MPGGAVDGAVVVKTKMDNSGLWSGEKQFHNAINSLKATVAKMRDDIGKATSNTAQATVDATKQMRDYDKEIQKTEADIEELQAKQQAWADAGMSPDSAPFAELDQKIFALMDQLDMLKAKQAEAASSAIDPASSLNAHIGGLARNLGSAAVGLARMAGSGAISFIRRLAAGAKNAAIQLAKLAGRAIANGVKRLATLAGGATRKLFGLARSARESGNGFNFSLKNVLKYGFGIRSLFTLFNRLRSAITESLGELAKTSPRLSSALTSLKTALSGLKGSLATAFEPIITAIAPALTSLINLLARAITYIGAFFAALTGRSTYYQANSGLSATANSASKAADAMTNAAKASSDLKRQLAGFDKLNILSASNSGGGGSGGGGGGGGTGTGTGISFTEMPIDGGIMDFVGRLRQLFESGDFSEIGGIIADKINDAFYRAAELISWNTIGDKLTEIIDAFTTGFNGFADRLDFDAIGTTIGTGINTIFMAARRLIRGINWGSLGSGIASALNGLVNTVDFDTIAGFFTDSLNALSELILGFALNFSWGDAGTRFGKALNKLFDPLVWVRLATSFITAINGVLDLLLNAVKSFKWGNAGKTFAKVLNKLFDRTTWLKLATLFTSALKGILDGLQSMVSGFGWGNAASTFATAINKLFDKELWHKLTNTFKSALRGITTWMKTFLKGFSWGDAGDALGTLLASLYDETTWSNIHASFETAMTGIFGEDGVIRHALSTFSLADAGVNFASVINGFFKNPETWKDVGTTFNQALNDALDFAIDFVGNVDVAQISADLRIMVGQIDWKSIAKKIWTLLVNAFNGLGNFIYDLIFGDADREMQEILAGTNWDTDTSEQTFLVPFGVDPTLVPDAGQKIQQQVDEQVTEIGGVKVPITPDKAKAQEIEVAVQTVEDAFSVLKPKLPFGMSLDNPNKSAKDTGKAGIEAFKALGVSDKTLKFLAAIGHPQGDTKDMAQKILEKFKALGSDDKTLKFLAAIGKPSGNASSMAEKIREKFAALKEKVRTLNFMANLVKKWTGSPLSYLNLTDLSTTVAVKIKAATGAIEAAFEAIKKKLKEYIESHFGFRNGLSYNAMSAINYTAPAMATGTVMPYDVAAQIAQSTAELQTTMDANNAALINAVTSIVSAQTAALVAAINNAPRNGGGLSADAIIRQINDRARVMGSSPLLGV